MNEEEQSLALIQFKLDNLQGEVKQLVDSDRQTARALAKLRVEENTLLNISATLERVNRSQDALWKRHEKLSETVVSNKGRWDDAADNQRKMIGWIISAVVLALVGMVVGTR